MTTSLNRPIATRKSSTAESRGETEPTEATPSIERKLADSPQSPSHGPQPERTVTLHWFLPTYGDSRSIMSGGHGAGLHHGQRAATIEYLSQIAQAAEHNGFESLLTPTGQWCADAWLTTAALISRTNKLKFLVALRPGLVSPLLLAQQAETFQRLSNGRLLLNVVVGGKDIEQRAFGDTLSKAERYDRAQEVLSILKDLWTQPEPVTFHGAHAHAEQASLAQRPAEQPGIYLGGSSKGAIETAARFSDVFLTWGEPPAHAAEKISTVHRAAQDAGRELSYGIRFHIIARPTSDEAWAEASRLLAGIAPEDVAAVQSGLQKSQSESQRRMTDLHGQGAAFAPGQDARQLEIYPGLWTGVGLVRGGAGTALVGSYDEVALLVKEYADAGFKHFILSGYPHLEETFHVGEGVVPALQKLGLAVSNHPSAEEAHAGPSEASIPFVPSPVATPTH